MWSFHNIWFWRKDDVLTLWGFLVNKFKNTHILVQQTSGPSVTFTLYSPPPKHSLWRYCMRASQNSSPHLHLLPHLNSTSSRLQLTVFYFIISCHTMNYIVFALVSTFNMIWVPFMSRENLKVRYFLGGLHITSTTNRITEQRSDTKENSSVTHFNHSSVFSACAISHSQFMTHYRTYTGLKLYCNK